MLDAFSLLPTHWHSVVIFRYMVHCVTSHRPIATAMLLPRGVRYYILRNNVVVPLVPVDQLPLQPRGLPHQLTSREMDEAGWRFVGETQEPPSLFSSNTFASQPALPNKTQHLSPDHDVRKDSTSAARGSQLSRGGTPPPAVLPEHTIHRPTSTSSPGRAASVLDVTPSVYSRETQRLDRRAPLATHVQPTVRQKEYCDFWMRTGECNYADFTKSRSGTGCIFKHEMPIDRQKLNELGFPHGIPRWYREKTAIDVAGGLNWSQRRMAEDNSVRKISDEPPASRDFNLFSLTNTRNELHAEKTSKPAEVEAVQAPAVIGDLICFDDSPLPTRPSSPPMSVSSSSSASSFHGAVPIIQPSKLLSQTMASVLREELKKANNEAPEAKNTDQPIKDSKTASGSRETLSSVNRPAATPSRSPRASVDSLLNETFCNKLDPENLLPELISLSTAPALKIHQEARHITDKVPEAKDGIQPVSNLHVASDSNSSRTSKSRMKRNFRPRKPADRPVPPSPQGGLASSRHATGNETKKVDNPSKGCKRPGAFSKGADLQSEITQRRRVVHGKERLTNQSASTSV